MNPAKKLFVLLILFVFFNSISCHHPDALAEKAKYVADLECRAIALRDQRFALANSIRFTQDTLLRLKENGDSIRLLQKLEKLNKEKSSLLQSSLQLADTIHLILDSVRKYNFKTIEDRKQFDEQVKKQLQKNNCKSD